MRRLIFVSLLIAASLPVIARADGGASIASAPELPIGTPVFSAVDRLDYWAVTVGAGDELVINFEAVSTSDRVGLCFMRPNVTDYTLADTACWQPKGTDNAEQGEKRQTKRIFGTAGRWTLIVGYQSTFGCVDDYVSPGCSTPITYKLTAYLHKYTRIMAKRLPRLVQVGKRLKLSGQVVGTTGGQIAIQERLRSKWKNLGITKLRTDGGFSYSVRPRTRGLHRYRVFYPGDQGHRASTVALKVTAIKRR